MIFYVVLEEKNERVVDRQAQIQEFAKVWMLGDNYTKKIVRFVIKFIIKCIIT